MLLLKRWIVLKLTRVILLASLSIISPQLYGQDNIIDDAWSYFTKGEYEHAMWTIDLGLLPPNDSLAEPDIWYNRGHIYKELYKRDQSQEIRSEYRNEAIRSFKKYIGFQKTEQRKVKDSKKGLNYLIATIYNDIIDQIDNQNFEYVESYFEKIQNLKIEADLEPFRIEELVDYYLYLGSAYNRVLEADPLGNPEIFDRIETIYKEVIMLDPESLESHYNLAVHHYNLAIVKMDLVPSCMSAPPITTLEISDIEELEENAVVLPYTYACIFDSEDPEKIQSVVSSMKKSILYLETAHEIEPEKLEIVFGLAVACFITGDMDRTKCLIQEYPVLEGKF